MRRLIWALVVATGCAANTPPNTAANDTDAGSAVDAGTDAGATSDAGPGIDAGPAGDAGPTLSLSIGPIALAAGEEKIVCIHMRIPMTTPINVTQIASTLAPGSHHLILYQDPNTTTESLTPADCMSLDIGHGEVPMYIAETESNNTLPLPSGVSYAMDASQMVKIEAHYINASSSAIMGMGTIVLSLGSQASYQKAGIMFCGSVSELYLSGVPPGMTTLSPGFYSPPAGSSIFGLTTHEHSRGTLMTLSKSTSASDPGTLLDNGTPYNNPPFVIYHEPNLLTFAASEGIRWQCQYNNTSAMTYKFGQSAVTNEMCYFWGYYYPAADHFLSRNDCWQ